MASLSQPIKRARKKMSFNTIIPGYLPAHLEMPHLQIWQSVFQVSLTTLNEDLTLHSEENLICMCLIHL